jgi:hypothetical protein
MAELHIISNYFLSRLDWQTTRDAVRLKMIIFAHDEAEEDTESFRLINTQPASALGGIPAVSTP